MNRAQHAKRLPDVGIDAMRRINSLGGCGVIELIRYDSRYKCRVVAATFSDPKNPADTETWFANRSRPEKV